MPSSHCTILVRFFSRRRVLINQRTNRCSFTRVTIAQCKFSKTQSEVIVVNPAVCEFWLKNTSVRTYSQWESKIQGSWKLRKDLFFVTKWLTLAIYKQHANILVSEYTDQVAYKKGLRDFPVNNILNIINKLIIKGTTRWFHFQVGYLDLCIYKFPCRSMFVNKSSFLITVCSGRTYYRP